MAPEFSLLTHIMQVEHLTVLDDWLEFIGVSPRRLILVTAPDPSIQGTVKEWASARGIPVEFSGVCESSLIAQRETELLSQQFEAAGSDLVVLVRLDTFPAREGDPQWFAISVEFMRAIGAQFLTGATKPYREDMATDNPDILITGRVSNNFLIIEATVWRRLQVLGQELDHDFGRFATEGVIEVICQRHALFGIRRLNTHSWRVFHTQAWGEEANSVRKAVKFGGTALNPFLEGYQDDLFGLPLWDQYFMFPRPSRVKLWRIAFGRWRRNLAACLKW